MEKSFLGIYISVWIATGALFISGWSLFLSIRNNRFNRRLEAAKIRTNLIQRVLLAKESFRELNWKIDAFDELLADSQKNETNEYRKTVKEAMELLNIVYDYANKDIIIDAVELERYVAKAETLLRGAKRRNMEATTAIEILRTKNHSDKPQK